MLLLILARPCAFFANTPSFFLNAQFKKTNFELYVNTEAVFQFLLIFSQTFPKHLSLIQHQMKIYKEYINFSGEKPFGLVTEGRRQLHYGLVRNQLHFKEGTSPWVSCSARSREGTNAEQRWGTLNAIFSCSPKVGSLPKASFLHNSLSRETGSEKCCSFGFSFPDPWS